MNLPRFTVLAVVACAATSVAGLSGCGSAEAERPKFLAELVPVKGEVTVNGTPVVGARITFHPAEGSERAESAVGETDDRGRYELSTLVAGSVNEPATGAVRGTYVVTISHITFPDGRPVPLETTEADAMAEGAAERIPARFSDLGSTELSATVDRQPTTRDFELKF